ncbi:MAG: diguanylate cyclase [Candidatus Andeanibacterium colombiense]|uniref:diguanylate cyclase n=1 Tax=Candidatus Andeanibacterium colombiense TaxID=3121345 RepID=A0AAJ5X818_9SPHN|nr:MAG: diguanylate cyclase [Sphingomonadaceae bacterium]
MRLPKRKGFAAVVALVWAASAMASFALRDAMGGVLLLWFPSAIAASALFLARKGERFPVLLALALGNLLINAWFQLSPLRSAGYVVANLSEPLIVVTVARWVVGRRGIKTLRLRDMVMMFLGVVAGSLASALISLPFRPHQNTVQFVWWVLATMLGTTVGAPILLYLNDWVQKLRRGDASVTTVPKLFFVSLAVLFALSLATLDTRQVPAVSLVLMVLVFIVTRYGQIGASCGVVVFGLAGTLHSVGQASPAAYLSHMPPFEAGIVLQLFMLGMVATSLPLAALLVQNDRLALRLKARNARMRENLLLLNMAEEVARIGRWRYDPRSGEQDWSRQMFLINGLDPTLGRDPGDIKAMLPDGGDELFGQLAHHSSDKAPYSFEYRIRPPHGDERILKMYATNNFSEDGDLSQMFGVVMDVTEHHQRQEALDKERTRAMRLAAEAQYLAHTDPLTGLANRRRTITQLEKNVRRSQQDGRGMAVISFDIDHFKRVNDTRGHQIGDDVLMRIADIARAQARASDLIGRMGGEEFVWLLPGAGADEAKAAAERLRHAIEQESSEGGLPGVTASIGYALWRGSDDAAQLLARVDKALYRAKEAGRNKVREAA